MALRILPFRQYSDHDVVNMYSVIDSDVLTSTTDTGAIHKNTIVGIWVDWQILLYIRI